MNKKKGNIIIVLLIVLFFFNAISLFITKNIFQQYEILHKKYIYQKALLLSESLLYATLKSISLKGAGQNNSEQFRFNFMQDNMSFDGKITINYKDENIIESCISTILNSNIECQIESVILYDGIHKKTVLSWNAK